MNIETFLAFKDPLFAISIIIAVISLVFILILSYYYKKLREQKIISEIVSEPSQEKHSKQQKSIIESTHAKPGLASTPKSEQSYEIISAQLSELFNQINSLNNYIKEIHSIISNSQKSTQNNELLENIGKLLPLLEQIQTDVKMLSQLRSASSVEEINNKLDNLLKLLSTLLQQ